MRKKRPFMLVELLISLLLLSLCLTPLIKPHLEIQKKKRAYLEHMQLEMLSNNAFCHLKESLYEQTYTWDEVTKKLKGELPKTYRTASNAYRCRFATHSIKKSYKLDESHRAAHLVQADFYFYNGNKTKGPFPHTFCVERIQE